jgi:hypothetical protein
MVDPGEAQLRERRERVAGGGRIGRVGLHQHHGLVAALHAPPEILGDLQHELHGAEREQAIALLDARRGGDHFEVAGVLQGAHQRARERARLGAHHRRRERLGIHVDGVAEEHELHHRHADHHGESEAVAAHLHELLHEHRRESVEGEHG